MRALIYLTLSLLVWAGCGNQHDQSPLQLNDGKKWVINDEMKPPLADARGILEDYISNDGQDFKQLASDLKAKNNELIKSCTMTGPAHDELHKWLHPYMEEVDQLADAQTQEEAGEIIGRLKESFDVFQKYFQ